MEHFFKDMDYRIIEAGKHIEVIGSESRIRECPILKLSNDEYIVRRTGEVKEFVHSTVGRSSNIKTLKRRMSLFRQMVWANNPSRMLTLTYAENMTDTKRLYSDFRSFWQRLKRFDSKIRGYIVAFEPQERGAWHAHMLLIGGKSLNPSSVASLWSHGFINLKSLRSKTKDAIRDVARYLTSYLCNLGKEKSKKGKRLYLYPAFFRFLRWSKGLIEPSVEKVSMNENGIIKFMSFLYGQIKQTYFVRTTVCKGDFVLTTDYSHYLLE